MLNSVPPYVKVTKIEELFKRSAAPSTSTSTNTASNGLKITFVLVDNTKLTGSALPTFIRHHLNDYEPNNHDDYHYNPSLREHTYTLTYYSKGGIKAMCRAIIRASQHGKEGYAGLLASQALGALAQQCLNTLMAASPATDGKYSSQLKPTLSDGTYITTFPSNSSPQLRDLGDNRLYVVNTTIGAQRRSKEIQVSIDNLARLVVNGLLPESMVFYDELGRQGYASRYNPHFISLEQHVATLSDQQSQDFLKAHASDLGQIAAQALFTGNVDLHLYNIAYDLAHDCLMLFDNDRAYMTQMGKYHGHSPEKCAKAFPPLSQRDLRTPYKPLDFSPEAWFFTSYNHIENDFIPVTAQKELLLPGLHQIMQENADFELAYYATLYGFSRLKQTEFETIFSAISNNDFRKKMADDFAKRAHELSINLWSMPEFYQCYRNHTQVFNNKLASLATHDINIPAVTDAISETTNNGIGIPAITEAEVKAHVLAALEIQIPKICDSTILEEKIKPIEDIQYNDKKKAFDISYEKLDELSYIARYIRSEISLVSNIIEKYSAYLTKQQLKQLETHNSHLQINNSKVFNILRENILTKKPFKQFNKINPINSLEEKIEESFATLKQPLNKCQDLQNVITINNSLKTITQEIHKFIEYMKYYDIIFRILENLQDSLLFIFIEHLVLISNECLALIGAWQTEISNINVKSLDSPAQCLQMFHEIDITQTHASALLNALNEAEISSQKSLKSAMTQVDHMIPIINVKKELLMNRLGASAISVLYQSNGFSLIQQIETLQPIASYLGEHATLEVLKGYHAFLGSTQETLSRLPQQLEDLPLQIPSFSRAERIAAVRTYFLQASTANSTHLAFWNLIEDVQRSARSKIQKASRHYRTTHIFDLYFPPKELVAPDFLLMERMCLMLKAIYNLEAFAHAYEHSTWATTCSHTPLASGLFVGSFQSSTLQAKRRPADAVTQYKIYQRYCNQQITAEKAWQQIVSIAVYTRIDRAYPKANQSWFQSFASIYSNEFDSWKTLDDIWQPPAGFARMEDITSVATASGATASSSTAMAPTASVVSEGPMTPILRRGSL